MASMFYVRSARALLLVHAASAAAAAAAAAAPHHPASRPVPRSASHTLPLTRQRAGKFNQPLSHFNTAKVPNMGRMFLVRSARALAPRRFESGLPRACR